jgi:hypothetical protein
MTNKNRLILFALICLAVPTHKTLSQENRPSLAETIEWLRTHATNSIVIDSQLLPKKSSKQKDIEWEFNSARKCILTWRGFISEGKSGSKTTRFVTAEINLSDFNPQRIDRNYFLFSSNNNTNRFWVVRLNTTDNKNLVAWSNQSGSFYSASISFKFTDEDLADGVVRAFENAIVLCGGKGKPNKPDPFIRKRRENNPPF